MDYANFGNNVRKYRQLKNFRQVELAEKCGCSDNYIGRIENARGNPTLRTVVKICNILGVTVDQLLKDDYANPEVVYLKEIGERLEKYSMEQRIVACEGLVKFLDYMEKFDESK